MSREIKDIKILKSKHFKGDVLITDPCYILRQDEQHNSDWEKCDYGDNMEKLGIKHYLTNDTLYGDWSCTVWKANKYEECTKENVVGNFCADTGLVSVFLLDEVRKYNPNIDEWIKEHDWCATIIKDFDGDVQMVAHLTEYTHEDDWIENGRVHWQKGDKFEGKYLELYGVVNDEIVWIAAQTGL